MRYILGFILAVGVLSPAMAQMSVTTFGATDAAACYENAINDLARDVSPCDKALKDSGTTIRDRKKTLVNRGLIHNRNGDLTAAIADFEEAISFDEGLAEAYLNRGNSYFMSSRYDEALRDYEIALSYKVSKPWAAWYNIGLVHDVNDEPEKAREAYENALALNPEFMLAKQKLEGRR